MLNSCFASINCTFATKQYRQQLEIYLFCFLGYYLTLAIIFFLGFLNSLQQNSCIAIASQLGGEYVGIFFVGTGASGTIICFFRIICLSIPALSDPFIGAIVYFSVAGAWNIFCIVIYFQFTKTTHFSAINDVKLNNTDQTDDSVVVSESMISNVQKHAQEKLGMFETIWWVNVQIFPIPICIVLIYIQTFMMFPGLALEKSFPSDYATWGPTLLILTYNIGDTFGKYVSGFRDYYTEAVQIIVLMLRFGFYATFILIVKGIITGYWFPFLNLFVFAAMNGYTTGGFMQLGPEQVSEPAQKERVGFVQALALTSGIMFGTFLALPMQKITPNN